MKKQIIIGCLLSIIVLLLVPSIPATQYSMMKEAKIEAIGQEIIKHTDTPSSLDFDKIKTMLSTILFDKQSVTKEDVIDQLQLGISQTSSTNDEQPLFFPFLGIFIYLLIFYIIYIVIVSILREIFNFIDVIVGNIQSKIQNFIQGIINIFLTIISLVFMLLKTIVEVIGTIGIAIINGIAALIVGIYNVFVFLLQGIAMLIVFAIKGLGMLLSAIWNGLGVFFRLLVDIFNLIIDAIFPNANTTL
ncbi:MAG: hypothetical protein KGY65_03925 [Candidatus Thermoplasmatota archaeon]|nr:hypothetical protein [Candidatus Thermoplasmatota archaeon]MBS3801879.1 hypothetical protein [Candidatus Thermoplasmatota archaeon]